MDTWTSVSRHCQLPAGCEASGLPWPPLGLALSTLLLWGRLRVSWSRVSSAAHSAKQKGNT